MPTFEPYDSTLEAINVELSAKLLSKNHHTETSQEVQRKNGSSEARTEENTFNFPGSYNISLQLCEPKNLLEKKRMLLGHTCLYDTNRSAWKASDSRTPLGTWIE